MRRVFFSEGELLPTPENSLFPSSCARGEVWLIQRDPNNVQIDLDNMKLIKEACLKARYILYERNLCQAVIIPSKEDEHEGMHIGYMDPKELHLSFQGQEPIITTLHKMPMDHVNLDNGQSLPPVMRP